MPWTTTEIEARYQETDQMGVIHHSTYIVWFEVGRTKHIKELGFTYGEMEKQGVLLPVINAHASYKTPIRYGDVVQIRTQLKKYDGLRIVYYYEVIAPNGDLAVHGETEHVFLDKERFKPFAVRKRYPEWHEAFLNAYKRGE